jgi:hypothetical protein
MQLVQGAMQVDFYPAAGLTDKFVQVTSFDGAEMSERLISKREWSVRQMSVSISMVIKW